MGCSFPFPDGSRSAHVRPNNLAFDRLDGTNGDRLRLSDGVATEDTGNRNIRFGGAEE
jgi:hypothetical protein